jgi:hypothetical protein
MAQRTAKSGKRYRTYDDDASEDAQSKPEKPPKLCHHAPKYHCRYYGSQAQDGTPRPGCTRRCPKSPDKAARFAFHLELLATKTLTADAMRAILEDAIFALRTILSNVLATPNQLAADLASYSYKLTGEDLRTAAERVRVALDAPRRYTSDREHAACRGRDPEALKAFLASAIHAYPDARERHQAWINDWTRLKRDERSAFHEAVIDRANRGVKEPPHPREFVTEMEVAPDVAEAIAGLEEVPF